MINIDRVDRALTDLNIPSEVRAIVYSRADVASSVMSRAISNETRDAAVDVYRHVDGSLLQLIDEYVVAMAEVAQDAHNEATSSFDPVRVVTGAFASQLTRYINTHSDPDYELATAETVAEEVSDLLAQDKESISQEIWGDDGIVVL